MATLNEIAYDLLTIVKPQVSDDNDIELEQIKFWIHNQRALWIRNELNRIRSIDASIQQTLCADLELVDASDCCGVDLCSDILRTKKKIPKSIELHAKEAITRVGPVNKTKRPFSYINYSQVPWIGNGKFNTKMIYAFLHDEYMFILPKNPKYNKMDKTIIRGVFEDPTLIAAFNDCDSNTPCYTDDDDYPIKNWMIPALKEAILKSNLMIASQAEQALGDDSNNAKSDVTNAGPAPTS